MKTTVLLLFGLLWPALANAECMARPSDDGAVVAYAAEMKMPWHPSKLRKVKEFKAPFDHDISGILSAVVCNHDGTRGTGEFPGLAAIQKLVK